jgi:hypothetical protein
MSRLDRVQAFRRIPSRCRLQARLAHHPRIETERSDIPRKPDACRTLAAEEVAVAEPDGTTYAARWRTLAEFSTSAKLAPECSI